MRRINMTKLPKSLAKEFEIESNHTFQVGRFTITEMKDTEGNVGVGISRCSDLDNFNRKLGITLSKGKARKALIKKRMGKKIQNPLMG